MRVGGKWTCRTTTTRQARRLGLSVGEREHDRPPALFKHGGLGCVWGKRPVSTCLCLFVCWSACLSLTGCRAVGLSIATLMENLLLVGGHCLPPKWGTDCSGVYCHFCTDRWGSSSGSRAAAAATAAAAAAVAIRYSHGLDSGRVRGGIGGMCSPIRLTTPILPLIS